MWDYLEYSEFYILSCCSFAEIFQEDDFRYFKFQKRYILSLSTWVAHIKKRRQLVPYDNIRLN
jgi:hypothetical protein